MGYVPKACGLVLVRGGPPSWEYLLLESRRRPGEGGLPKGHVEPGETERETALRETREETGLEDLDPAPGFRRAIEYPARRRGRTWRKTVVYFLARAGEGEVVLSHEHAAHAWLPLSEALARIPFENLRGVVEEAALFLKDAALFDLRPAPEQEADAHLAALPEATAALLGHLRGAAALARAFAASLAARGCPVHVEAAAVGTLLHDVGRALGRHEDHQVAGVEHLRRTPLAPYGYACISHFTKGAPPEDLRAAGLAEETLDRFEALVDGSFLTWEERCAALADACMSGERRVAPPERFEDLRRRYGPSPLIDLQERETEAVRGRLAEALGRDPLDLVGLGG